MIHITFTEPNAHGCTIVQVVNDVSGNMWEDVVCLDAWRVGRSVDTGAREALSPRMFWERLMVTVQCSWNRSVACNRYKILDVLYVSAGFTEMGLKIPVEWPFNKY